MSLRDLLAAAREVVAEVDVQEGVRLYGSGAKIVDVREPDETAQGVIPGSLIIPRGVLETTAATSLPERSRPLVITCATGVRSLLAAVTLQQLGYSDVVSLAGGFTAWKAAGLEWELPRGLPADRLARYSRHLLLPEVGASGQQRLLESKVLIVGAGGLGSPVALYLAAAGVGTIGLADMDSVDLTNLQRQVIHSSFTVGMPKVASAARALRALNPDVDVVEHPVRVDDSNALDLVSGYDVVVDGADNFDVRYALCDASISAGVPVVYGSVFRFEGQVTVFDPGAGFTYRGFMPIPPSPEVAPDCATAGVLGVLPGIIGTIQATETLKLLLGLGSPLVGRMLVIDALEMDTTVLRLDPTHPQ